MSYIKAFLQKAFALILAIVLVCGLGGSVGAAPVDPGSTWMGPENRISPIQTPTDADRLNPVVAYNSNRGQYLVVWLNQWPGNLDIYGQRVGGSGQLIGNWFAISAGSNNRLYPAVAYNATDDEYLVVFMYDASGNGTRYDLMAQRVNWDGSLIGSHFLVMTYENVSFYYPKVIWKEAYNEYLIVWESRDASTGLANGIAIRLIDSVGGLRYGTILTSTDSPGDPDLIWDPTLERYLIVWSYTNAAGHRAVMGDLRDGDANRIGGITNPFVLFSSDTNDVYHPRVSSNGSLFLSVYEYIYSPSDMDIKASWVTSDASLVIPIDISTSGANETAPAIATGYNRQEFMVLFERTSSGQPEIWLRPISNTIPAAEVEICNFEYWDCLAPAGAYGPPGYLFTYSSHAILLAGLYHVYGRMYYTNVTFIPMVLR